MLSSVSQLNLQEKKTDKGEMRNLGRITASVTFSFGVEKYVRFASSHDIFRDFLHRRIIEMHPAAFVVGISRVMSIACAGSLMNDDSGQVVDTC